MLSRLGNFVHQFLEYGFFIFATCKRNYVYSKKPFSSYLLVTKYIIFELASISNSHTVAFCTGFLVDGSLLLIIGN